VKRLIVVAVILLPALMVAGLMLTASAQSGTTVVGIDADPTGNTATSLGTIERCIEVSSGQTFDIDVFVDAIPQDRELAGFGYSMTYDSSKLRVDACNHEMLLASQPGSDVSTAPECDPESLPDTDGVLIVGAWDFGTPEPGSPGVLGRYQLRAVGSGLTVLSLAMAEMGDLAAQAIPIDELHDGTSLPAYGIIAIDVPCAEPTPTPESTPTLSPTPTPVPTSTIETLGIDADPSGNTATSLGTIERCIEVSSGESFDIDVFVDAIPEDRELWGFSYNLHYDSGRLRVTGCNQDMLLASQPGSDVDDAGDCGYFPQTDGQFNTGAYDFGTVEPGGSLGVLGRYKLQAVGSGSSVLTLSVVSIGDLAGEIPIDELHDGAWTPMYGVIAIDEPCDGAPTPTPEPTPTPTPTSTAETLGIDADPSGNAGTSLGTIDRRICVDSGDTFDIDVFVDAIPDDRDLGGFNYYLNYDSSKLQVNACNHNMLLASTPGGEVWDLCDDVDETGTPDTDGQLLVGAADLWPPAVPGGSLGVLGRYEFQAIASGTSVLTLSPMIDFLGDSTGNSIAVNQVLDGNWEPPYGVILVDADSDGDGVNDCLDLDLEDIDGDGLANADDPDDDNDGWVDAGGPVAGKADEAYLGTVAIDDCPDSPPGPGGDAWPLDVNADMSISATGDVLPYSGNISKSVAQHPELQRLDLNGDRSISIVGDVLFFAGNLGRGCN
jgi:hypothetical protein